MNVKNKYSTLVIFLLGALIFSCAREDVSLTPQEFDSDFTLIEAKSYFQEHIGSIVPVDFSVNHNHDCDDPAHNHESTDTKSFTAVKSLIPDWGKATQVVKGDAIIINIPLQEQDPYAAVLFFKKDGKTTTKQGSTVSTFVMAKETKTQVIRTFASTVIGEGVPAENIQSSSPWLFTGDKSAFTGFQIISDEKGNYLASYAYDNGVTHITRAQYAKDNQKLMEQDAFFGYSLVPIQLGTKSGGCMWCPDCDKLWSLQNTTCGDCGGQLEYTLDPAVVLEILFCPGCFFPLAFCTCNSGGTNPYSCPFCGSLYCFWQCRVGGCYFCGGPYCLGQCQGGGGGTNPPTPSYTVSLSANPIASGNFSGAGYFQSGTTVDISAYANFGYKFVNWTGGISASTSTYSFLLFENKSITANFRPCFDTNKGNPLPSMALAPPVGSQPIAATWGNTRTNKDGTTKNHNGIDLAGAVGTPIYAQFSGTIGNVVSGQPNRVNGNYPSGYSGDDNDAGNRVYIDATVNGSTVSFGYWHLQAGTPLATNPRTGQPWATGNTIYAGEVIGYIGITGNANSNVPHLHLTNGANANPTTYLNATVSTATTTITTPCD